MKRQRIRSSLLIAGALLFLAILTVSERARVQGAASRPQGGNLDLSLTVFATGFSNPIGITSAGQGDSRIFVLEQAGAVRIVQSNGSVLATPFLDIQSRVDSSSTEEGLLGIAFHPNYAQNGYFYLNYTNTSGGTRRTRISRFSVTQNPDVADPNSEEILLTVVQPNSNHNAGGIHFGPDGFLYIPLGDGGGSGDTANNAQNMGLLLGKVARIDVNSGGGTNPDCVGIGAGNYTVPVDNPFVDGPGGTCDEIWASGLRNPWQSSFDRLTGDFFLGDVGQAAWEEVDYQPASSAGGENYGWRCYEGNDEFDTTIGCGPIGNYTFPIFQFVSSGNCSVVGGFVYRGSDYPAMYGRYLLTDYCSGNFWDLEPAGGGAWTSTLHTNLTAFGYAAFGENSSGELFVANRDTATVYRLVENSGLPTFTPTATATSTPTVTPTPPPHTPIPITPVVDLQLPVMPHLAP